ncbi:hypothetical protein P3S67_022711 [Capsicum chacoense]
MQIAFVVSHVAISPKVYWKVKLPNTQISKAINDFLPHTGVNTNSNPKVYHGYFDFGMSPLHHAATKDDICE